MRIALESNKITEQQETSAHPGSPNFDSAYANQVMGDIAEQLRQILASDFNCRPPGLRTEAQQGGLRLVADNPEVGIGLSVMISLLPVSPPQTLPQPPGGLPVSGPAPTVGPAAGPPGPVPAAQFGPPPAQTPGAPTASRQGRARRDAYAPVGKLSIAPGIGKGRNTQKLYPRKEMQQFNCPAGMELDVVEFLRNRGFDAQGQEGSGKVLVLIDREDSEADQAHVESVIQRLSKSI